ncbi:MAG: hypothetical protein JO281_01475 [Pseudonocardiales bacterium]|nr:hypothetical protein [Pseudonocardiales bacterium]
MITEARNVLAPAREVEEFELEVQRMIGTPRPILSSTRSRAGGVNRPR